MGKTYETTAVPGFPIPRSYSDQLSRLQGDDAGPLDEDLVATQYALMQQLVPVLKLFAFFISKVHVLIHGFLRAKP